MFRLAATLFSVFLSCMAFPPGPYPYVALIAMVPFFLALVGTGPGQGALLGFVYGFLFWIKAIWWVKTGAVNWVGFTPFLGWVIAVGFAVFHSIPYLFFGLVQGWNRVNQPGLSIFKNSVLLTVCLGFFPSIFPGNIVHSFYAAPLVIQMADIGGIHLLLWILLLMNLLLASAIFKIYKKQKWRLPVLGLTAIAGIVCFYGQYRMDEYNSLANNALSKEFIKIAAIQPNIPIKSFANDNTYLENAIGYTADAIKEQFSDADLVVWPEVPISLPADCDEIKASGLLELVQSMGKPLLFNGLRTEDIPSLTSGTISAEQGDMVHHDVATYPDWGYYNIAKLLLPGTGCGPEYAKKILFPFGEYLPYEKQLPFLRKWLPGVLHYKPGPALKLFEIAKKNIIPSLCYEVIFSDHTREMVKAGGNIIINMSDDAWFGDTSAAHIHFSLALFRSVEYRIPLVRVTNSGFGAFVRATGEIEPGSITPLFSQAAQAYALYLPGKTSIYYDIGDSILYLFLLLAGIIILTSKKI